MKQTHSNKMPWIKFYKSSSNLGARLGPSPSVITIGTTPNLCLICSSPSRDQAFQDWTKVPAPYLSTSKATPKMTHIVMSVKSWLASWLNMGANKNTSVSASVRTFLGKANWGEKPLSRSGWHLLVAVGGKEVWRKSVLLAMLHASLGPHLSSCCYLDYTIPQWHHNPASLASQCKQRSGALQESSQPSVP